MDGFEIINEVLNHLGINAKALSEKLGYDRPQIIYDLKNGKTKVVSVALANKISSVFPQFEKSWLLTGEGEMLKADKNIVQSPPGEYEKLPAGSSIIEFLMEQNRSLEKIVHDQNDIIKTQLQRITDLEAELDRGKNESTAHGKDAECAVAV